MIYILIKKVVARVQTYAITDLRAGDITCKIQCKLRGLLLVHVTHCSYTLIKKQNQTYKIGRKEIVILGGCWGRE